MKKQLLTTLFILVASLISVAQTTAIPDPNFEQALIDLGLDSGPIDGVITTKNIETSVSYLTLSNKNITDLTGIGDFLNLTRLNCENNNITSLDVSQNLALATLVCHNNGMTNLNLNGNIFLKYLDCSDNELTTLDMIWLDKLSSLKCSNNQLTALDVSHSTALKFLECNTNQIETLDLSLLTRLERLDCGSNKITSLDLSQHIVLTFLSCPDDQLIYLDVRNGNNTNMTDFNVLGNLNLSCIFVDDVTYSSTNWTQIDTASTFVENQMACEALGINDFELANFSVYPNPARNIININGSTAFTKIEIYSILGTKVLETSKTKQIDVSALSAGLYILNAHNENAKASIKIMIY